MGPSVPQGHSDDWLVDYATDRSVWVDDCFRFVLRNIFARYTAIETAGFTLRGRWAYGVRTSPTVWSSSSRLLSSLMCAYRLCLVVRVYSYGQYHTCTTTHPVVLSKKIDWSSHLDRFIYPKVPLVPGENPAGTSSKYMFRIEVLLVESIA